MKKLLAALTLLACTCIASSAMAAGAKVPKLLCFNAGTIVQQLSFKAVGTVYIDGLKVKTYAINGIDDYGPLTGTAYVIPDTTTLRASYTTTYTSQSNPDPVDAGYNLVFNLGTGTGTLDLRYANPPDNDVAYDTIAVSSIDCLEASKGAR